MSKKIFFIVAGLLLLVALAGSLRFFSGEEDGWICQGGVWVKHGNPSYSMPTSGCGKKEEVKTDSVRVYFHNQNLDPEVTCDKVFPVERKIIASSNMYYEAAVVELLAGPKDNEKALGYGTAINDNVKLQKLEFSDGVMTVDFDKQMEFQLGGSCRVGLIKRQIEETLKQFPEVKEVIISIDGRTEDILQP